MPWNQLRFYLTDFARLPPVQHAVFVEQANAGGTLNGILSCYRGTPIPLPLLRSHQELQALLQDAGVQQPLWTQWRTSRRKRGLGLILPRAGQSPLLLLPEGMRPHALNLSSVPPVTDLRLPEDETLGYFNIESLRFPSPSSGLGGGLEDVTAWKSALATGSLQGMLRVFESKTGYFTSDGPVPAEAAMDLGLHYLLGEVIGFRPPSPDWVSLSQSSPAPANLLEDVRETVGRVTTLTGPRRLHLPPQLRRVFDHMSGAFGPFRRLKEISHFFMALSGLAEIEKAISPEVRELIALRSDSTRFLQSLLYLGLQKRQDLLSAERVCALLDQAARWQKELGDRYEGSDLVEKAMRAELPRFMGSEPLSPLYEIAVAASLLRDASVIRVAPIDLQKRNVTPDYRVVRRLADLSERQFFVEAKLFQPDPQDLSSQTHHKFSGALHQIRIQFRGYEASASSDGNTAYLAVVDDREVLDPHGAREVYLRWMRSRLASEQARRMGRIDRIHVDFYGPGFAKKDEIEEGFPA